MPGGRFVMIKKPSSLVVDNRSRPVPSALAWTTAPGTLAPFGSYTFPVSWPELICPKATPDRKATTNRAVRSALLCPLKNCTRHDISKSSILYFGFIRLSDELRRYGTGSVSDLSIDQQRYRELNRLGYRSMGFLIDAQVAHAPRTVSPAFIFG